MGRTQKACLIVSEILYQTRRQISIFLILWLAVEALSVENFTVGGKLSLEVWWIATGVVESRPHIEAGGEVKMPNPHQTWRFWQRNALIRFGE